MDNKSCSRSSITAEDRDYEPYTIASDTKTDLSRGCLASRARTETMRTSLNPVQDSWVLTRSTSSLLMGASAAGLCSPKLGTWSRARADLIGPRRRGGGQSELTIEFLLRYSAQVWN